jgi:SsrA-binding protein
MQPILNKKAGFEYEIIDKYEVGIVLEGPEVKSIANGQMTLTDSFVKILGGEMFLINANVTRYPFAAMKEYDPFRTRKLLAKKSEILKLMAKMKQGNLALIPLRAYFSKKHLKVEIGLARGRKHYEKKLRDKERDLQMEEHRESRKIVV